MTRQLTPVEVVRRSEPYRVPRAATPIDLSLDGNEGACPPAGLLEAVGQADGEILRRYPGTDELVALLAEKVGVGSGEVVVTAGADDAIDRVCRAVLEPGKNMVIAVPTFEMIPRFAEICGAEVRRIDVGDEGYDLEALLDAVDESTALVVMISPNNPNGIAANESDMERLASTCPQALVLIDHAYVEFGGDDFTAQAVDYPNVVVTRTLSKAWGLAGLRVGYAVANEEIIRWLRTTGLPYPVSKPSQLLASRWISEGGESVARFVEKVQEERGRLQSLFDELQIPRSASKANFVFARVGDGLWWRDGMAGMGIGVRAFPGKEGLEDAIRIACPGDGEHLERVEHAIRTIAAPEAILFDLDGVFADVSQSYRRAVIETVAHFGVTVTNDDIAAVKERGDANNDWRVTQELLAERGVEISLEEVTERFELLYQGTDEEPGFRADEKLLIDHQFLEDLQSRGLKMGIVTGRPRRDCRRFLESRDIAEYFPVTVCMEDGPLKPDPAPVKSAMEQLDVSTAWFVGDTPDDMRAGRGARVLPLGVIAPGHEVDEMKRALFEAGAGRVLGNLSEILEVLR